MTIKLLTFGQINEWLPNQHVEVEIEDSKNLLDYLIQTYPKLSTIPFALSVNKNIIHDSVKLKDQDEVALLPPFSGG